MEKFIKLLKEFVAIESVSTDKSYKSEIDKAAKWLLDFAKKSGLKTEIIKGYDNPIVIIRTPKKPALQTILVYGHYDVQPAKTSDGWRTAPFSLSSRNGKLYGRGSADNKGQILMHLFSVVKLLRENRLGYNVIFLIEGNEETGSPVLSNFIRDYKDKLATDCIIISDGEIAGDGIPALEGSFRGSANLEVTLKTAKDDVHSGLFGGVMPNAGLELTRIVSKIHDKNQRILVKGFYSDLKKIRDKNETRMDFRKLTGTKIVFARSETEYKVRTGLEPAVEITGLKTGYIEEGFRNSIPSKASTKINLRSAPEQDPDRLFLLLKNFLRSNTPDYAEIKIQLDRASIGARLETENQFAVRAKKLLKEVYKKDPITKHSGGTLPIVSDFQKYLKAPQVMIPLANADCGMHSASENISLDCIKKGLEFSEKFFSS